MGFHKRDGNKFSACRLEPRISLLFTFNGPGVQFCASLLFGQPTNVLKTLISFFAVLYFVLLCARYINKVAVGPRFGCRREGGGGEVRGGVYGIERREMCTRLPGGLLTCLYGTGVTTPLSPSIDLSICF